MRPSGATDASQEEVVDLQEVHADGKSKDTRTSQRPQRNTVGIVAVTQICIIEESLLPL